MCELKLLTPTSWFIWHFSNHSEIADRYSSASSGRGKYPTIGVQSFGVDESIAVKFSAGEDIVMLPIRKQKNHSAETDGEKLV